MGTVRNMDTSTDYTGASALADAIAAATAGDTLRTSGTITEHALATTKALHYTSDAGDPAIWDGDGNATILSYGEGSSFTGITMTGTTSYLVRGNGAVRTADWSLCTFRDAALGIGFAEDGSTFDRCIFDTIAGALANSPTKAFTFTACLVVDCAEGLRVPQSLVEQTTVEGCTAGSYGIYADTVRSSIAADNAATVAGIRWATAEASNCSHGHSTNFYATPSASSITSDPVFIDAAGGDYGLSPASPCRAAGTTPTAATVDLAGVLFASPYSMGAYQFVDATPPVVTITSGATPTTTAYTLTGTVTEPSATLSTLRYRLNGGALTSLTAAAAFEVDLTLRRGRNTIYVVAADEYGNEGFAVIAVTVPKRLTTRRTSGADLLAALPSSLRSAP